MINYYWFLTTVFERYWSDITYESLMENTVEIDDHRVIQDLPHRTTVRYYSEEVDGVLNKIPVTLKPIIDYATHYKN